MDNKPVIERVEPIKYALMVTLVNGIAQRYGIQCIKIISRMVVTVLCFTVQRVPAKLIILNHRTTESCDVFVLEPETCVICNRDLGVLFKKQSLV